MTSAAIHYVTANEWLYLELSVSVLVGYWWVHRVVVLHTDRIQPRYFGRLSRQHPKVVERWRPFGSGWLRQPESGGFDEIAARNCAVDLAARQGVGWVVKCDSDEFYTEQFGHELRRAEQEGKCAVTVNWNQLLDPTHVRQQCPMTRQIVAWQSNRGIRYRPCTDRVMKNRTMHCAPGLGEWGYDSCYVADGHFYFHIRHMIGSKRHPDAKMPRSPIPASLVPNCYMRRYQQESRAPRSSTTHSRQMSLGSFKVSISFTR